MSQPFNIDPRELEETVNILQECLLNCQRSQREWGKDLDFAAGFARGVEVATMFGVSGIVKQLTCGKTPNGTMLLTFKQLKELHEAAHVLNSDTPDCEGMTECMRDLIFFLAEKILERRKEKE